MNIPRSMAVIKFPAYLIDEEVRKHLDREETGTFSLDDAIVAIEEVRDEVGIFSLEDDQATYGKFQDLETILKTKSIPFDRESAMGMGIGWQRSPELRVYRPQDTQGNEIDRTFLLDDETEKPVVSVAAIRELLGRDDLVGAAAIRRHLDDNFPAYPPLSDWVKEVKEDGIL